MKRMLLAVSSTFALGMITMPTLASDAGSPSVEVLEGLYPGKVYSPSHSSCKSIILSLLSRICGPWAA